MKLLVSKVRRTISEVKKNIYFNHEIIPAFDMKDGFYRNIEEVDNSTNPWKEYKRGDFWGGRDIDAWFRFNVSIPERMKGQEVALYVCTGITDVDREETTTNPQMLLYVNGELIQGLDINHKEFILIKEAQGGETYQIDIKTNSGMFQRKINLCAELVAVNEGARNLYYNMKNPFDVAMNLPEVDYNKVKLLEALDATCNLIDLRKPQSELFNKSIESANQFIEVELYEKLCGHEDAIASVIGHTHIDVAWLWTVAQTREKVARSFSTVLSLMEQYPEYKFMSSTPQLYKFIKEDYPELYEKIKERIKEGRWEADGAMWVESDCILVSGESLVRQILYGTRFFRDELGVECSTLWLPDVFGYSIAIPQILKRSDIKYFMTTKIGWNDTNRFPYDTFMWRGNDGTEILTHMITTAYPRQSVTSYATDYNGQLFPQTIMDGFAKYRENNINNDILISYGYGDGGGGPTKEMIENHRRLNRGIPGCPKTVVKTVNEYFNELEEKVMGHKKLPKWVGELYFEYHRGTYTSMARNKKSNRKCENNLLNLEQLSTLKASLIGGEYPKSKLDKHWELVLMNQFHDILPGSSIGEVYDVTKVEYEAIEKDLKEAIDLTVREISSNIELTEDSIVVFNTLAYNRDDIVVIPYDSKFENAIIKDEDGSCISYEVSHKDEEKKVVFFAKGIPSNGYKVYSIVSGTCNCKKDEEFVVNETKIENKFFSIDIDENGVFTSIFHKINNRQVLKEGERGNKLLACEDKPVAWDNWNLSKFHKEKVWEVNDVSSIKLVEDGDARKVLRIERSFLDSKIVQDIIVYKEIGRIDFDTYADWKETDIVLKASFPVDINTDKATFDVQFGNIERTTHENTSWDQAQYEVPVLKWADISEEGYGVALLNDCKYGYDVKDNDLDLTLLKCGTYPNPNADREEHRFMYSLYPHAGNFKEGKVNEMAYKLNVPTVAVIEEKHHGKLPKSISFLSVENDNVALETIKRAEDDNSIIVRMYEFCNKRSTIKVNTHLAIEEVKECNLMERELCTIDSNENSFEFNIKPFEIRTFKLKLK